MKLEGVHHITAITGRAQQNVDFYAGTLGLRMVKKTVNQDDPTVYHLFYADEEGDAGSDITFFEYPGARQGRAGDGMVSGVRWRVGSDEALEFWEKRLAERRHSERARRRPPALRRPRGPRPRPEGGRDHRRAADRRPPRGPQGAGAAGVRRRPRLLGRPRAQRTAAGDARVRAPRRRRRRLGGSRREPRRPLGLRRPTAGARNPRRGDRSTTSHGRRRSTSTRPGARR